MRARTSHDARQQVLWFPMGGVLGALAGATTGVAVGASGLGGPLARWLVDFRPARP